MAFAWHPNRDSGCIASHRNPDTKRRYPRGETIENMISPSYRNYVNSQLRAALPLLRMGNYDISFPRWHRGWDAGDPFMPGHHDTVVVEVYNLVDLDDEYDYDIESMFRSSYWDDDDYCDTCRGVCVGDFDLPIDDITYPEPDPIPAVREWELSWADIAS